MLCPRNGDGVVTIDSMTSLHPKYSFQPVVALDTPRSTNPEVAVCVGASTAEKLEGTSRSVDGDFLLFPPASPFPVSRYCPTRVSLIPFPPPHPFSPLNSAKGSRFAASLHIYLYFTKSFGHPAAKEFSASGGLSPNHLTSEKMTVSHNS